MNLILLTPEDFVGGDRVRLTGRRLEHVRSVHRAAAGDELTVGMIGGRIGRGVVTLLGDHALEMAITLDADPPAPLPLALAIALPRPKVLNRVVAAVASMGIKRLCLINSWRVEKSYWKSPRLAEANLRQQVLFGLEQGRDTILPSITIHRFFRRFIEVDLPELAAGTRGLVAHPHAASNCPREVKEPVTLAVGPEGGFIAEEIASFERAGFTPVAIGERILRVETAVAYLVGRLF